MTKNNFEFKRYSDCVDFIEIIEKEFPVNSWKIKDFDLWPYIRIELAFFLAQKAGSIPIQCGKPEKINSKRFFFLFFRKIKRYLKEFQRVVTDTGINADSFATINNNGLFAPPIDVIYLSQSSTVTKLNGKWYNIFFDPINEYLDLKGKKHLTLEYSNEAGIQNPKWINNYLDLNALIAAEPALNRFITEPFAVRLNRYDEFLNYLANCIGGFPESVQTNNIELNANQMYYTSLFFQAILKRSSPKYVFITCYYFDLGFALCHAAQKMNIKSIDMQHGVMEAWPAYSNWTKIPAKGYSTIPDMFWTWTVSDANYINKWAKRTIRHKAYDFGNTWLIAWNDQKNRVFGKLGLPNVEFDEFKKKYSRIVLYTGQPLHNGAVIPEFIKETCRKSPVDWLWLIRIHPRQLEQLPAVCVEFAPIKNVIIKESSILPLPFLLKFTTIHITSESAVIIEAASLGIASVITSKKGCDFFSAYLESGILNYCDPDSNMLIDAIKKIGNAEPDSSKVISWSIEAAMDQLLT